MANVILQMLEGRSLEQKQRLVKAIADAMVEHANARLEDLDVLIQEYPRKHWARGAAMLGTDRTDT